MGKQRSPVVEYLTSLRWDGEKRIGRVIAEVLNVAKKNRPTATKILRRWFISAVARAMKPGCRVDTSLILQGAQGVGKSRFFEILGGEWHQDFHGMQQSPEPWIVHREELERCSKAFLAARNDRAGEHVVPRSYVIVGTTNAFVPYTAYARRISVILVRGGNANRHLNPKLHTTPRIFTMYLEDWRNQLWAEAVAAYRAGEPWHEVTP